MNLTAFEKLDRVIHERGRLAIMSMLAASESLTFRELKEALHMTDGNLSVHMRTLEEAGYVTVHKSFVNRKPRTQYGLTEAGKSAFQIYIHLLEEIVQQSQHAEAARPAAVRERAAALQPGLIAAK